MSTILLALTWATTIGAGVVAGVFFAFSTFVMPALGRLAESEATTAMQQINIKAINPWFMTALFGTALTSLAVIALAFANWRSPYGPYLIAAGAVYLIGCIGVTMAFNVPRNTALARLAPTSTETAEAWSRYLTEWTAWNHVRTIASLAAAAALIGGITAG